VRFGHEAIDRNDPAEQERIMKFNTPLANQVIFHTALDITAALRQVATFGLDDHTTVHGLRHRSATTWVHCGTDLVIVAALLGHARREDPQTHPPERRRVHTSPRPAPRRRV
jgi:integrase